MFVVRRHIKSTNTNVIIIMHVSTIKVLAVVLVLCLLWMDTCLYYQIQDISIDGDQFSIKNIDGSNQTITMTTTTATSYSQKKTKTSSFMDKFSFAFQGMSVKLMMTDPVDNYLLSPLAEAFAEMFNFKDNFWFITPNLVSYSGVVSALIAAKLVSFDSEPLHKLSYLMFQLRTWLDDLDGAIARSRLGIHIHVSLKETPGYVIDGVCDAIGFVAYIIGCYMFLKKTIRRRRNARPVNRYNLQSITEIKSTSPSNYIPLQEGCVEDCLDAEHQEDVNSVDEDDGDGDGDGEEVHFDYYRSRDKRSLVANDSARNIGVSGGRTSGRCSRYKVYLEKIQNGKQSSVIFYRYIKEKLKNNLNNRQLFLVTLCFSLQIAMCAAFWNRYILVYRDLLESPSKDLHEATIKTKILKSNMMYIIIWFWRLTNGHSFMQMLIASVFVGKLWQFLDFIKYIGFIEIILLATVTELHIIDVRNFLNQATT